MRVRLALVDPDDLPDVQETDDGGTGRVDALRKRGRVMANESTDRTGDVLRDAATDLRADWPWYADALLVMINGLETIAMRSMGPDSYEAASVLEHAKRVAQGERDSVEPLLPPCARSMARQPKREETDDHE